MEIVIDKDILLIIERVKNDRNGNPKYEIIPIDLLTKNNICCMLDDRYKVNKASNKLIVKTYNINEVIDNIINLIGYN